MRKSFKAENEHDANLVELIISNENDEFTLELISVTENKTLTLQKMIQGGIRSFEVENPILQNFKIIYDEKYQRAKTVKLLGNINNALALMRYGELISENLFLKVTQDENTKLILEKSKEFILLENKPYNDEKKQEPPHITFRMF